MKYSIVRSVTTALMTFLPMYAASAQSVAPKRLTITGSSTIAPIILEMAKAFEAKNSGVRIDVQTGGTSKGIADARQGKADIGMASRAAKPEEGDLKWTLIANDGLAIIVHKQNTVKELSADQIRALFRGEIKEWSLVGGSKGPITLVHKAEGRSTLEIFIDFFALKNPEIKPHSIVGDNEQGVRTIAANPTAIGYVSVGTAETSVADGVPLRLLPSGGIAATTANVANGTYPLRRELNLVTREAVSPTAAAFIAYATSQGAERFIKEQAFVPPPR